MAAERLTDRVPPQDLEAEQSTLGSMLIDQGAATRALAILQPGDFYRDAHKLIYEACLQVHNRDEPVDLVTVSAELRRTGHLEGVGGPEYLTALIDEVPTAAHVVRYAQIVLEKATLRRLIECGHQIMALGFENPPAAADAVDEAERIVYDVAQRRVSRDFVPIGPIIKGSFELLDTRQRHESHITGVPTGIHDLDDFTSGLQPSNLVIVAGRPSMGKSSLAIFNFARHAALEHKIPVGVFSLEESSRQLAEGMLAAHARVDAWKLRRGALSFDDWRGISNAVGRLYDAPIFIDDTPAISVLEMRSKARRLKSEHDVKMLVLDYLQLATAGSNQEGRYQEVSLITRSLKGLARELDIPVVACSQLSRTVERREEKRPILSDLLESGAIEAEADLVLFVYRAGYYEQREKAKQEEERRKAQGGPPGRPPGAPPGVPPAPQQQRSDSLADSGKPDPAEIIIAKHRTGPIGTVHCMFHGAHRCFENLSVRREGPPS
jgi:replicative DNA helicase